ncbi:MAG TPA: PAS domain-containing protein [Bryobacteraceae bacterium]|nr:PAS domain-containing protein [Bryobacteraceae bacterium]
MPEGTRSASERAAAAAAPPTPHVAIDDWRSRYEFLTEALPQIVWIGDTEGRTEFVNAWWYEYTGMPRGEDVNNYWARIVHPADLQLTVAAWQQASAAGEPYSLEFRLRRASDQSWRWHMARHQPFRGADGRVLRWIGTAIDIDDRRRAEEIVRGNEERLRVALAASSTGTWRWDPERDCFNRGENLNRLLGLEPAVMSGSLADFVRCVHQEDRGRLQEAMQQALHDTAEFDLDIRVVRPDGSLRWLRDQGRVIPGRAGDAPFVTGACVDITERKLAAEALARQAQQLARSNADLQHFAYVTSHDLQEPLRMIANFADLLSRRHADKLDAEAREYLEYVVNSAQRMSALIRDLLSYSRLVNVENVPMAPVDAAAALKWALLNLQVTIEEAKAQVTSDPLPRVLADQVQLVQLFQNLVGNAIKYRGQRPPEVHISAQRDRDLWRFSVRDNGIGIAPQYQERIFGVFKRLHGREYPGTGIGLAICKAIAEKHGGHIWVESKPGEGATFFFTIPAATP